MGINRVKRRAQRLRRQRLPHAVAEVPLADAVAQGCADAARIRGRPADGPAVDAGQQVEMLHSGDQAYPRMLEEIGRAQKSVGLCSYIFRADSAGEKFHQALIQAQRAA